MDKIKVMGFHQPLSTIFFDDPPYPNDTPKFHLIYIKRSVKDVKRLHRSVWCSLLGKKTVKKILWGLQQNPLRGTRVKVIVA